MEFQLLLAAPTIDQFLFIEKLDRFKLFKFEGVAGGTLEFGYWFLCIFVGELGAGHPEGLLGLFWIGLRKMVFLECFKFLSLDNFLVLFFGNFFLACVHLFKTFERFYLSGVS